MNTANEASRRTVNDNVTSSHGIPVSNLKPLVVVLQLEAVSKLCEEFTSQGHLGKKLSQRALLRRAETSYQARRYLTSTTRPHAVIVTDNAVTLPKYRDVLQLLVDYAAAGGTVVYAGMFSSFTISPDIEFMFKSAWGLPWRPCAYSRETIAINPLIKGLHVNMLVPQYSMKATYLGDVAPSDAVYLELPQIRKLKKSRAGQSSATCKTPAAFAAIGRGRVGYVGDVNGEKDTTSLILAMCFHPASRAPPAPGTGSPISEQGSAGVAGSPPLPPPRERNLLIVSLEKEPWADDIYESLYQVLKKKSKVTEVLTTRAATQALSSTPPPDAILVSDAAITRRKYATVRDKLIEYARSGGIVVLGMQFSNHLPLDQARSFFARWGVPWDAGSYHRTTFGLNPDGLPAPLSKDALQPSYSMKAVHLKNAPRDTAVYLPTTESRVESFVFPRTPITGASAEESPAVFARVGQGYLGYLGDVNGEQGSTRLLLEMLGVKIQPGDLGGRTYAASLMIRPDGTTEAVNETEEEIPLPPPQPAPRAPGEREAEVRVRAEARAKVREEKLKQGDLLKNEGNELYQAGKWAESAEKYRAAALLAGPQPVYLSNLAASFIKLQLWDLAESAATRALLHDPKHLKALYRRGVARKEQNRLVAAESDLKRLLVIDRTNHTASEELDDIRDRMDANVDDDWPGDEQLEKRAPDRALEIEDESDSEDFAHAGNGTPCRFYNHGGCRHGARCRFKHSPDSKSVRDELGRNVCVYWLLGHCRHGDRCVYAHDKTYLPVLGWWTDEARLARLRKEFDDAVKAAPLPARPGQAEHVLAEALKPTPWRKDLWAVADAYEKVASAAEERRRDEEEDWVSDEWEDEWDERAENFGYLRGDVEDMQMYGIKPWDLDAYEELTRIREALGEY